MSTTFAESRGLGRLGTWAARQAKEAVPSLLLRWKRADLKIEVELEAVLNFAPSCHVANSRTKMLNKCKSHKSPSASGVRAITPF